jgi:hypothetical protein
MNQRELKTGNRRRSPWLLAILAMASMFVAGLRRGSRLCTANSEGTTGRHHCATTKLANEGFASKHLLVYLVAGNADYVDVANNGAPYGITDDCPAALGDPINVHYLGKAAGTLRLTVTGAMAEQVDVYATTNGSGQGQPLPAAAGTYWLIGRTMRAAAQAGDASYYAEVETHRPLKVIVDANGNATCTII